MGTCRGGLGSTKLRTRPRPARRRGGRDALDCLLPPQARREGASADAKNTAHRCLTRRRRGEETSGGGAETRGGEAGCIYSNRPAGIWIQRPRCPPRPQGYPQKTDRQASSTLNHWQLQCEGGFVFGNPPLIREFAADYLYTLADWRNALIYCPPPPSYR